MIEYPGIYNVNKELALFDETKPTIFIDIDGVMNPLPYEREWIGPERPLAGGLWDRGYSDPKNWQWNTLTPNLALQYPISRQIEVELDLWLDYSPGYIELYLDKTAQEKRYRKLRISLMDEMLDEMRALIKKHDAQVVYLTFWRSEAIRLLEPELRLGGELYLNWATGSDRGHRLKIDALQDFYEQTNIRTPFIILDDESTVGLTDPTTQLWYNNPRYADKHPEKALQIKELNAIPKLIFQQDAHWGVERAQVQQIREFLESLKTP